MRRYNRRMGEPAIGSTLGGYRVDALIARGGMGVVYRATHLALDRPVALKRIWSGREEDANARKRMLSMGVECYLAKPLEESEFIGCLRSACARGNAPRDSG
jgi:DNA-binding NarL/FixJ family response regulator